MRKSDIIKLVYWDAPNLGDLLSPYIVHKLSKKRIFHKSGYISFIPLLKELIVCILRLQFKRMSELLFPWEKNILAIGSIISLGNRCSLIWGSGFMSEKESFKGGTVLAVRGEYTSRKLGKMGYGICKILGDPALLLPLCFAPALQKKYKLGVIPHWSETDFFIERYSRDYQIIDLRTRNVEETLKEILACEYILSTSLHGIIISHAYGIPALWIKHQTIHLDDFKFKDYFSSVGIEIYDAFRNIDDVLFVPEYWMSLFEANKKRALPQISLRNIQKKLLDVAPFLIDENIYMKLK